MRVLLSAMGSRGDVQPLAVLAAALQSAGHTVILAVPPDASSLARSLGVPHVACGRDVTAWLAALDTATISPLALVREFRDMLDHDLQQQAAVLIDAARAGHGVDVVVTGGLQLLGNAIAERVGAASVYACYGPNLLASGDHPPLFVAPQRLPRFLNRMLHAATSFFADRVVMPAVNRERTRLGLVAQRHFGDAMPRDVLLAWDTTLCPMPADARSLGRTNSPNHNALRAHDVGALLPAPTALDEQLDAFIARDTTPCVYVGFGSMPDHDPTQTFALVDEAARHANVRVVLLAPHLRDVTTNERVHVVASVSHAALFPRMHAIVHHAGAGTTATASRAGVPQIAVPHFLDQPMWAVRLQQRGVSAATIARASLDARTLGDALRTCLDDVALRDRARALRDDLAALHAPARAVHALEAIAHRSRDGEFSAHAEAIERGARFTPSEALT